MNKKQITYWLSVIVIGIVLGLGLQFVRAWTEPTQAPPGGNVGAPINTGANEQTKTGDICTTAPNGTGAKKCLSTASAPAAPTCGNGFCESGENTSNCAGDCPAPYVPPAPPPCECGIIDCGESYSQSSGVCDYGGIGIVYWCVSPGTLVPVPYNNCMMFSWG